MTIFSLITNRRLNFGDVTWYSGFKLAIAEDSSGGSLLSESEMSAMTTPFNATQQATLRRFLNRWNNTVAAWQNGTLSSMASGPDVMHYRKLNTQFDQYKQDTKKAKDVSLYIHYLPSPTFIMY